MSKRKRYDDKFRAGAVVMLQAQGYPDTKGALTKVANHLHVPAMTISRWFRAAQNPPPHDLVTEKELDLVALLKTELTQIFTAFPTARPDASFKDLATAAGIMIDKLQLLENKPTERVDHTGNVGLTIEERASRIAAILDAARARRDGRVDRPTDD
jgi:hypothetical protein